MNRLPTIRPDRVRDMLVPRPSDDSLEALYPVPRSPLEVLTLTDGPWASLEPRVRLSMLISSRALPDPLLRLFAARCASRVQPPDADSRSLTAINTSERHAYGEAAYAELVTAHAAALDAAIAADSGRSSWKSKQCAVWASAWTAVWAAECDEETRDIAASVAAIWAAERSAQAAAERACKKVTSWTVPMTAEQSDAWYGAWYAAWYSSLHDLASLITHWESHGCLPPRDAFPQATTTEATR